MAGVVKIPWYATAFRADRLADALAEIAAVALRYGAQRYDVHRSTEDRYRFMQSAVFEDRLDWDRYWYGPEFQEFRTRYASWFQVPIVYEWHEVVAEGALRAPEEIEQPSTPSVRS
jgi:quinol monooxygenase YgiN